MGSVVPSDQWYGSAGLALASFAALMAAAAYLSGHGGTLEGGERWRWRAGLLRWGSAGVVLRSII